MKQQRGMTFIGLVFVIAAIVFVAVIAMKLWPAYNEYFSIKKAFASLKSQIAANENMSPRDIVAAFDRQAIIDNIQSIHGKDLVIQQANGHPVVSVEYSYVAPLMANVSALVDFTLSTDETATKAE